VDGAALDRPVIGMISRMVDQKGLDLIAALASELPRLGAIWVVLGTGEARYQDLWLDLAARAPDRIGVRIGFDEGLAHLIEAGADIFVMPSRFEPCGLTQLYSLRYGTVPVVRSTGGLADTVEPWSPETRQGTGFRFDTPDGTGMIWALDQALATYKGKGTWRRLMRNGMARDFSWERSARAYEGLYRRAISRA
jgi:starch synthase